jgi:hypothetical protein
VELSNSSRAASTGLASGGGHGDQLAIGRQFQHRFRVGLAHQGELLGAELQAWRQHQGLDHFELEGRRLLWIQAVR